MPKTEINQENDSDYSPMTDKEKTESMLDRVLELIDTHKKNDKYWLHFKQKAADMRNGIGPISDAQFLLHCNVYYLRELFEDCNDYEGLTILEQLEVDCF
ncbi:N(2)-fixation sustaining protein CowN [Vibrio salinus]|uniref:N(2)-fixation sustaining protein CowN n=1 Tax=Vibrio salinus TaxID=2899784 RepID=UPI001E497DF9|nr:N(2)-fixation sustaining protein CowN [Vibrio salinus]MCE0495309.1 N(2)-fixation sustaining protein CowN [Vibrio salinus]